MTKDTRFRWLSNTARDLAPEEESQLDKAFVEVVHKHGADSPQAVLKALGL